MSGPPVRTPPPGPTWKYRCDALPYKTVYLDGLCFVYRSDFDCAEALGRLNSSLGVSLLPFSESAQVAALRKLSRFKQVSADSVCVLSEWGGRVEALSQGRQLPLRLRAVRGLLLPAEREDRHVRRGPGRLRGPGRTPARGGERLGEPAPARWAQVQVQGSEYVDEKTKAPVWLGIERKGKQWRNPTVKTSAVPIYFRWIGAHKGEPGPAECSLQRPPTASCWTAFTAASGRPSRPTRSTGSFARRRRSDPENL